jgi:hypothetical protein
MNTTVSLLNTEWCLFILQFTLLVGACCEKKIEILFSKKMFSKKDNERIILIYITIHFPHCLQISIDSLQCDSILPLSKWDQSVIYYISNVLQLLL